MAEVTFEGVSKRYGDTLAVDTLDLSVPDGELLALLGPSGCGKTTALRMVAGLEEVTAGAITIGGRAVNDVDPKDRDVAMVFQSYALYPHLTVLGNVEFPLRQQGLGKEERHRRVKEVATTLGLEELLGRKPGQLSGGQRQRVALARAIVRDPKVFLMDEPLSNLDAALRVQTRADIAALQQRLGTTTLYVTHDQVEAMTMGHRIAVMSAGVLQQVAPPQELYDHPANVFVARFLGSPGMNLFPGRTATSGTGTGIESGSDPGTGSGPGGVAVAGGSLPLPAEISNRIGGDREVWAGVRPEHLRLDPGGTISAMVTITEMLGAETHVICKLPDDTIAVVRQGADDARPGRGEAVRIVVSPGAVHLFDKQSGRRIEGTGTDTDAGTGEETGKGTGTGRHAVDSR